MKAIENGSWWSHYAAPARFYPLAGHLVTPLFLMAAVLASIGLYIGFIVAPTDWQQGESYRIIFIHVPAAWMSMINLFGDGFLGRFSTRP